jgi:ParB-like chromosome segregation protein Spo0J
MTAIEQLSIESLGIDRRVQRECNHTWVAKIARDFDPNQLGIITVSRRDDGCVVVLDGQHRIEALRRVGLEGHEVDCRVLVGLTLEEEARTFRLLNNTSKPNLIDHFLVRVVEGDEVALDVKKILAKFGWQPSRNKIAGSFSAISTLEVIYRSDRQAAWWTIQTVTEAWGNCLAAAHGQIIAGLGGVYQRHGDEVNLSRMVQRLGAIDPLEFLTRARALAAARGRRVGAAVSELAIAEHNRGRGAQLPDWNAPRRKNRVADTERIRALAKVASEAGDTAPAAPLFADAAELFKATPDNSQTIWR